MTGLIYKDFLALKGHLSTYVVFFVIYGGLCIAGVFSPWVLAGMVVLIGNARYRISELLSGAAPGTRFSLR